MAKGSGEDGFGCARPSGNRGAQLTHALKRPVASHSHHVESDTQLTTCLPSETAGPVRLVVKWRDDRIVVI